MMDPDPNNIKNFRGENVTIDSNLIRIGPITGYGLVLVKDITNGNTNTGYIRDSHLFRK